MAKEDLRLETIHSITRGVHLRGAHDTPWYGNIFWMDSLLVEKGHL